MGYDKLARTAKPTSAPETKGDKFLVGKFKKGRGRWAKMKEPSRRSKYRGARVGTAFSGGGWSYGRMGDQGLGLSSFLSGLM